MNALPTVQRQPRNVVPSAEVGADGSVRTFDNLSDSADTPESADPPEGDDA